MIDQLIICPDCKGADVQKYGKTKAGEQKYRCMHLGCRRQFVPGSEHLITPEIKNNVLAMIRANVEPLKIYQAANPDGIEKISLRWIYQLKRRELNDRKKAG